MRAGVVSIEFNVDGIDRLWGGYMSLKDRYSLSRRLAQNTQVAEFVRLLAWRIVLHVNRGDAVL